MLLGSPCKTSRPYHKLSQDISEISPFSGQNRVNQEGQGGPRIFFLMGIFLFLLLGSPCKNLKTYDNPFWYFEQVVWKEREREREIMPSLMATSALAQALRSDQNLLISNISQKGLSQRSETLDMTSERLGNMFESNSADTCAGKFPLPSMGG